jgi:hypothetical protein
MIPAGVNKHSLVILDYFVFQSNWGQIDMADVWALPGFSLVPG